MFDQRVPHVVAPSNSLGRSFEGNGEPFILVGEVGVRHDHTLAGQEAHTAVVFTPCNIDHSVALINLPKPGFVGAQALKTEAVRSEMPKRILRHDQTVNRGIGEGEKRFISDL